VSRNQSRAYFVWTGIHRRCYNKTFKSYPHYGGRGIFVCAEWHDFKAFLFDMGEPPAGTSIDRIDNDGPYSKENCRWATMTMQNRNKRDTRFISIDGTTMCLKDWALSVGLKYATVRSRLEAGWPPERALTTRVRPWGR
jgi:hypothetical protein